MATECSARSLRSDLDARQRFIEPLVRDDYTVSTSRTPACLTNKTERGYMATTTTPQSRESHKKLKPKPKTESKSWQTRNMARKEKQTAHAATLAAKTER